MSDSKPFFLSQTQGFAGCDESADFLHPKENAEIDDDSATETQYFGFSVPEAGIHSLNYLWHHPRLNVVSGGPWVWQGHKRTALHAEICDLRTYVNDSCLQNDLHDYRMVNGYGVKIIEPLRKFHVSYADPARANAFDLRYEAVHAPVMWANGRHFEQPMHATGELILRGKRYDVDCYTIRDRSWGKARPEHNMSVPPMSWISACFNKDFSLCCSVFDQAQGNPELAGTAFDMPAEKTLCGGWLLKDGKLGWITKIGKSVRRDPHSQLAQSAELHIADEHGRSVQLQGQLVATCPWQTWGNIMMNICLMKWQCETHVAYGDLQDAMWSDYYNFMSQRPQ